MRAGIDNQLVFDNYRTMTDPDILHAHTQNLAGLTTKAVSSKHS